MLTRRGRAEPLTIATGITACACGTGDDRRFSGDFETLRCATCHQVCTFETTTLSRRAARESERELRRLFPPHVCTGTKGK